MDAVVNKQPHQSRQDIADAHGISLTTLNRWMARHLNTEGTGSGSHKNVPARMLKPRRKKTATSSTSKQKTLF
ncbi:MAG TPA: hypothetical protein H9867_05390 [Candidatus Corynebacterium gallistercoris]|uniref:Transposase n=1 Tax=Candidatus Corynebacterium gallistercoris TaxID=2838530 RepID=A0A9D1RY69_9CORY|nr:hypothetical protein [Candidatus Corynebacterium gallistercoris]